MADALWHERFMQPSDEWLGDDDLTDDELCQLALAADPDQSVAADAVPSTSTRRSLRPGRTCRAGTWRR